MTLLKRWNSDFRVREKYSEPSRFPFYDLAKKYLPENKEALLVDVGPGKGEFADYLEIKKTFHNHRLLDVNHETVKQLSSKGFYAEQYSAPDKLPFLDESVDYIHLSHIVEHLSYQDLYTFMKEMNRVLCPGGVLVLSTPLLWERFYEDLSHVKPYYPEVFINYLTRTKDNATQSPVSTEYSVKELQYRYRSVESVEWGSRYFIIEVMIRIFRVFRSKLGFRRYIKNGYTLVLQKNSGK